VRAPLRVDSELSVRTGFREGERSRKGAPFELESCAVLHGERSKRAAVLLYDIDGTLVDTGGAGRRAMELAFGRTHGREDACASFVFGGMTDPAIARRGLSAIGAVVTSEAMARVLDAYLEALEDELSRAERFRVLPHVVHALDRSRDRGHAIGLGTGNLLHGARLKLERARIFERFAFGGYGSDAEDRAELLAHGAARGREIVGDPQAEVLVIGDTPRDIEAAHAIGARCLAVATGRFKVADLEPLGPALVVETLADPRALAMLEA
jgi:phosphoglycolate phosphatase